MSENSTERLSDLTRFIVDLPVSPSMADVAGAPAAVIDRIIRTIGTPEIGFIPASRSHREAETGVAVERVWAEITEANHPVAETVLVAFFDESYGEWSLAVKEAPVPHPWTHFLRPGRPDASPQRETEGDAK